MENEVTNFAQFFVHGASVLKVDADPTEFDVAVRADAQEAEDGLTNFARLRGGDTEAESVATEKQDLAKKTKPSEEGADEGSGDTKAEKSVPLKQHRYSLKKKIRTRKNTDGPAVEGSKTGAVDADAEVSDDETSAEVFDDETSKPSEEGAHDCAK
eukprot:GHVP01025130.1.p1 GENE.GHVP01025130.1~~GHVP01025130.1.p1  ORF type:complete len:156 (+),score=46.40 GHVP01025130.1:30-497(+)